MVAVVSRHWAVTALVAFALVQATVELLGGDGVTELDGDCDDEDGWVYPDAEETTAMATSTRAATTKRRTGRPPPRTAAATHPEGRLRSW